jgi:hypothetical protein
LLEDPGDESFGDGFIEDAHCNQTTIG